MERVDSALQTIPSREQIMGRVERALDSLPSPEALSSVVERRIEAAMPAREELAKDLREALERKIQTSVSDSNVKEALLRHLPDTDQMLSAIIREAIPRKDKFQETLASTLAQAVQNSLPERVWVESVSRGLFDEKTKGLLPDREQVVALLREEIQSKLLGTVEQIIRQEIEKITSGLSS
jgi:hypothetical protein